jgi:hypothetical protein
MIRICRILILLLLVFPFAATSEEEPRFTVELPEGEIIVGQPLLLRLQILVPTWMPKPPVWPTLEVPSLLVRLPERASNAVSETINGETWSGISRAYRLYPLEVGRFEIPRQKLIVTYAAPGKPDPIIKEIMLDAIQFTAVLPKGAKDLNPPIVANGLTLTQQFDGGPDLEPGDAVTRTVTAQIEGTTVILLPDLFGIQADEQGDDPLRAYPKEPVIKETEQRGVLSGSKTQTTTYVAQAGGTSELPEITLRWYNLESQQVETAKLPGLKINVKAPPPPPPSALDYARWLGVLIGSLVLILGSVRLLWPSLGRLQRRIVATWKSSEFYAHRRVKAAFRAKDLNETMAALEHWSCFYPCSNPETLSGVSNALAGIGAMKYRKAYNDSEKTSWANLSRTYSALRTNLRVARKIGKEEGTLPDLNPTTSSEKPMHLGL